MPISINFVTFSDINSFKRDHYELQDAIKSGSKEVKDLLSRKELNLNISLPNGELPLHFAIREGRKEIIDLLIEHKADPKTKDANGLNAFDYAISWGKSDIAAQMIGIKAFTDLQVFEKEINSEYKFVLAPKVEALNYYINSITKVDYNTILSGQAAAYVGNTALVSEFLKESHTDPSLLLFYAVFGGHAEVIDLLINAGANPQVTLNTGESLLHFASLTGSTTVLEKLISLGLDPNQLNIRGETPLHFAACTDNLKSLEMLVGKGGNPYATCFNGLSPFKIAGYYARVRDPLALTGLQVTMFSLTATYWLSQIVMPKEWFETNEGVLFSFVIGAFNHYFELAYSVQNLALWKQYAAILSYFPFQMATLKEINLLPTGLRTIAQSWQTFQVTYHAFKGIKASGDYFAVRKWDAIKNIVVNSVNTIESVKNLLMGPLFQRLITEQTERQDRKDKEWKAQWEQQKKEFDEQSEKWKEENKKWKKDWDEQQKQWYEESKKWKEEWDQQKKQWHEENKKWKEFLNQWKMNSGSYKSGSYKIPPGTFEDPAEVNRILSREDALKQTHVSPILACEVLFQTCNWDEKEKRKPDDLDSISRKLARKYHPDKATNDQVKPIYDRLSATVNNARDALKKHYEKASK